jgi:hypothetical protein
MPDFADPDPAHADRNTIICNLIAGAGRGPGASASAAKREFRAVRRHGRGDTTSGEKR